MSDIPLKSATIICAVHKESPLAGCAVCNHINLFRVEAQKYKDTREKLLEKLVQHLKDRKAIITDIA